MANSTISRVMNMSTASTVSPTPTPLVISPHEPTTHPLPEQQEDDSAQALSYVFLPLAAVAVVLIATAMVLLLLRKKRLDRLRHHLMPLYNFDTTEGEQEDWEAELLEESSEYGNLRRGYKSMEFPTAQSTSGFY